MNYIPAIFKAMLAITIFSIGSFIASTGYENIVIVGLGLIYVTIDIGISSLRQQQNDTLILNIRMQQDMLRVTAPKEYDSNIRTYDKYLSMYYDKSDVIGNSLVIQFISAALIVIGCLYLVYQTLTL